MKIELDTPITINEAKITIIEFCKHYPVAAQIFYKPRDTQEELYRTHAIKEKFGSIKGAYRPGDGGVRRHRCDIACANIHDNDDLIATLMHEILGHFGINTFSAGEKVQLLTSIINARNQPGLSTLWTDVERVYPKLTECRKAEEVFSSVCESIQLACLVGPVSGHQAFKDTCSTSSRLMSLQDLTAITYMVSDGLRDRARTTQIFPINPNDQFRIQGDERLTVVDKALTYAEKTIESPGARADLIKRFEKILQSSLAVDSKFNTAYKQVNKDEMIRVLYEVQVKVKSVNFRNQWD